MKGILVALLGAGVLACTALPALAVNDYSQYTTEQLSQMRGTMQNNNAAEHEAFRNEWQKRVQNMTQEERQQYFGRPADSGSNSNWPSRGGGYGQSMGSGMGGGMGRGGMGGGGGGGRR